MIEINGKYTGAKIYTNQPQQAAIEQIDELVNQSFMTGTKVRIMPDYHAGKGLGALDFNALDAVIRRYVPSGNDIHEDAIDHNALEPFHNANFIASGLQNDYTGRSLGTLGGGNHFIELAKDEVGVHYLLIHTGSRYVGAKVANWHQKRAFELLQREDLTEKIDALKHAGRMQEIQAMIEGYKQENPVIPKDLSYLQGDAFHDYIADMKLAQRFAHENRMRIAEIISEHMKWEFSSQFDSVHNYIDTDAMILRKGAVRAAEGEQLVIPMNMRDGSLICIGKGNPDWNESAPHGAGRIYSRTAAMKNLSMTDFKETMAGIWTTSVSEQTLDEAPMAYKPMQEIVEQIGETVTIQKHITPVYNFKASDKWME